MRILCTCCPLYGHVNAVLPAALAARRAGHDVVLATGADMLDHVERHGIEAWPAGPAHADAGGNEQASWLDYFAATAPPRAADLAARTGTWRPDLVIADETELAGGAIAAACGARLVVHGLGPMPPAHIEPVLRAGLERTAEHIGPAAGIEGTLRHATYWHRCPPGLQPAGPSMWPDVRPLRPDDVPAGDGETLPAALTSLPHARTVLLTLGTVYNAATDVLARAIEALATLPANLIVTAGPDADPTRFGVQPAHVRIERYVSYALLMPRCALLVSQAGAGGMFAALRSGLPQLMLPQGADQFGNADAAVASGAALALGPADALAPAITAAARCLLDEPSFTANAQRLRAQIEAMPDARTALSDVIRDAPR